MRQRLPHIFASLSLIAFVLLGGVVIFASGEVAASVTVASTTGEGAQIANDEVVTYLVSAQVTGIPYGTVTPVSIQVAETTYLGCVVPAGTSVKSSGLVPFEVKCQVRNAPPAGMTVVSPTFTVTVAGKVYIPTKAYGSFVIASGVDAVNKHFDVFAVQHPNRILNGSYDFGDALTARPRRRADGQDKTQTEISMSKPGHEAQNNEYIYPYESYASGDTATDLLDENGHSGVAQYNACSDYFGPGSCASASVSGGVSPCITTYQMDLPKASQIATSGGWYEVPNLSDDKSVLTILFYNPTSSSTQVNHLSELTSGDVATTMTVTLPEKFPHLVFEGSTTDGGMTKTYTYLPGGRPNANTFMARGGWYEFPRTDWSEYAVENGRSGEITVKTSVSVSETRWKYVKIGETSFQCGRHIVIPATCDECSEVHDYQVVSRPKPIFAWVLQSTRTEQLDAPIATATIDVYSSTAWVQTKGGNIGTNGDGVVLKDVQGNRIATDASRFKYAGGEEFFSGENTKQTLNTSQSFADMYTPRNQSNADFMVFAKPQATLGSMEAALTSLISRSNWYHEIPATDIFTNEKKQQRYGYDTKGEEYDRDVFKRDFPTDLLQHQIFGRVIDLSKISKAGVIVAGTAITITDTFELERGVVYHIPSGYTLTLGEPGRDLHLTGSSARIQADKGGVIAINGNIVYGSHSAVNYLDVPNLRIDAGEGGTITIAPHVEYIESQLRAGTLSTGHSENQLRILGDVIADTTNFQRSPVNVYDPENYEQNPPSELIIEDLRKYVVPPPGDTTLRTSDSTWGQVNPETGESIDPY